MATTAVMTSNAFLHVIRENKLVAEEKLQDCLRTLSPPVLAGTEAMPLADVLVERRLLTRFQANLLLQGKSKSLRITSKYRLLDRLGAGGMGLVYLCEHIRMKRLVALKVLPNTQAKEPGNLDRFYREAQAVAALKHNNIVQAYDVDTDNGIHYLVMEYIDGINLENLIANHGPLDEVRAAHYMAQAAEGLQHAAERGLVHRDIKPSNLLVDREGYIKVLDMGLARFFDTRADNLTQKFDNNAVIGTADFISPEQALNSHDVDIRADIYSLGCTFYYLLTGRAPFQDANITQKLLLHQIRDPEPIEQIVPGIDPDIVDIVSKMMAKRPEDRYQLPGEAVAALAPWTEESILPPSLEELPENPHTGSFERSGSCSTLSNNMTVSSPRQAPRPGRGMVTERLTESAIRRIDGLPNPDDEIGQPSKKRWIISGLVLLAALAGLQIIIFKPWESSTPTSKREETKKSTAEEEMAPLFVPKIVPKMAKKDAPPVVPPQPQPVALPPGFIQVRLDRNMPLPLVKNASIRAQPTDVLIFSGPELRQSSQNAQSFLDALRKQQWGGKGEAGTTQASIVPYALALFSDNDRLPNTLVSVDEKGGLRPLERSDKDYFATTTLEGTKPDQNCLVREKATLPSGTTTINTLVADLVDFTAAKEGSTLRLASGTALFHGTAQHNVTFGAGTNPLSLDFNGNSAYLSLSSGQNFNDPNAIREFIVRAQLINFGNNPLVLSGLGGNILRLEHPANANAELVIQGTEMYVKPWAFHVRFSADSQLGRANGRITVNQAVLEYTGSGSVEIDRPLVTRIGELKVDKREGRLRWTGKISGGRLAVWGEGQVVLTSADNDFTDGIEVWNGGTLVLQAENGRPAGSGGIRVHPGGTLSGTATIVKEIVMSAGTFLQPGSEDGKSLVCNAPLILERDKNPEKNATIHFRLANASAKPLIYSGPPPLDLANANVEVTLGADFIPAADTKCFLITNRSNVRSPNTFNKVPPNGTVKTKEGNWSAKISYEGNAEKGTTNGGADVVIYDFDALKP